MPLPGVGNGDTFPGEFLPCFRADRETAERLILGVLLPRSCAAGFEAARSAPLQGGHPDVL